MVHDDGDSFIPEMKETAGGKMISPKALIITIVALLLGSVGLSEWLLRQEIPETVPLVIAHRAGPVDAGEQPFRDEDGAGRRRGRQG